MKKLIFAFTCLLFVIPCRARIITVDDDGPADFNNIQAAINDANDGDIVIVADGIYTGDGNRDIDFLGKAITVRSTDPNDSAVVVATVIDCQTSGRGFSFDSGEMPSSFLAGFTIINGSASSGGGIYCTSSPTISRCTISDCSATWGGGINCSNPGSPTISRCTIIGNSAIYGGGIRCYKNDPIISHCTIIANSSVATAGGIECYHSSPMIRHCMITNNIVEYYGGGMDCFYGEPIISHCTIAGNLAGDSTGGIRDVNSKLKISHCIIWGNTPPDDPITGTVSYSDVKGVFVGEGNIDADPLFVNPDHRDYHLSIDSPCINAGDPCYSNEPEETDIDGDPRVIGGRIDIGPDEANYGVPLIRISPAEIEFHTPKDGSDPENQILSIYNVGSGILKWEVIEDCTWLEVNPYSGETISEIDEVVLSVNVSGLDTGQYNCELMISDPCAGNNPHTFVVSLYIYDGGELYVPSEYGTIQEGIEWAFNGATVIVADGIYTGAGNRNINFKGKAITVLSENGPQNCVIDCEHAYNTRGFIFNNGEDTNSVLSGFTIKRGRTLSYGGGIYCSGSSPMIENCIIINNIVTNYDCGRSYGGGIYCGSNSNPTIVGCIIRNNTVSGGSGLDFGMDGESGHGGGIYCSADSQAIIEGCIVSDNSVVGGNGFKMIYPVWGGDGSGGGIYGNVTINNSAIIRNTALGGDGDFGGNGYGGGIYAISATINNGTLSDNIATGGQGYPVGEGYSYGGGIYIEDGTTLTNCILWANAASFGPEIYGSGLVSYSNIQGGYEGEGNINAAPGFADPFISDYHLKSQAGRWEPASETWVLDDVTSPCIDAGNPGCPLGNEPNDVNNVRINMGAYGGTAEASKSPANFRSIADMTNDWVVDSNDLKVFVDYWLQTGECIPSDLNHSQSVDFNDFAIFGLQWSYPTAFEVGMTFHIDDCNMEAGLNWTAAEESNEPRFKVWIEGRYIYFEDQMYANCCPGELGLDKEINGNQITLYEIGYGGFCYCMCYFPITATLGPFEDGTYTVEVYDNYGNSLGIVEVTIGDSTEPDITFQIDDCSLFSAAGWESETRFTVTVEGLYIHFEDTLVANCCPDELGLEMTVEDNLITIYETEYTSEGCRCVCFYPVTATLGPFEPGTYILEVYEYHDGFIGSTSVVIDPPQ